MNTNFPFGDYESLKLIQLVQQYPDIYEGTNTILPSRKYRVSLNRKWKKIAEELRLEGL